MRKRENASSCPERPARSKEEQIFTAGEKAWPSDTTVYIKGADQLYVSRGGKKLERALEVFGIDLTDRTVLDIGASTGGFTDVCLRKGAKLVYALDVQNESAGLETAHR
ncbi:MAG: SAM-dependent methyltransferase [Alkalibacterium sp.]|nr:SAM-dependent methyltransferase [Alkalibacterium sp.]